MRLIQERVGIVSGNADPEGVRGTEKGREPGATTWGNLDDVIIPHFWGRLHTLLGPTTTVNPVRNDDISRVFKLKVPYETKRSALSASHYPLCSIYPHWTSDTQNWTQRESIRFENYSQDGGPCSPNYHVQDAQEGGSGYHD